MPGSKERRLYFKWCAKRAMGESGNLLRFIGAVFVMLALLNAFLYVFETVCLFAVGGISIALLAAEIFMAFLVISPMIISLWRMAYRMWRGETTELADILWAFRRSEIFRVYVISFYCLSRICLMLLLSFAAGKGLAVYLEGLEPDLFSTLTCIFTAVIFPFTVGFFGKCFMLPIAYFETGTLTAAFELSGRASKGRLSEISAFCAGFVPLMLLSVLTLGILFFVYILPLYMISACGMVSYFMGCVNSENYRK